MAKYHTTITQPMSEKQHVTAQESHYPPVTTMLETSKNVLFPGYNHVLTTGADDSLVLRR